MQCIKKGVEFYAIVPGNSSKPPRSQIQVKWTTPNPGYVKLNTDRAICGVHGKAGGGGVLRCSSGNWVAGFARKLGAVSSIIAELWALKDGLLLAKQLNLLNVNIELDAEFIVHLLSHLNTVNLMLEPLLNDCRTLINSMPNCTVTHIFQEANSCAGSMANMGADISTDFQILYEPPPCGGECASF